MAFKLDESGSYQWPVTVEIPSDGGEYIKQSFEVKFKRITQTRIREIGNEIEANKLTDVDLVKEVTIGWDGIEDEKGDEVVFSSGKLKTLLDRPRVATAIGTAFLESVMGAKRKN